MPRMIWLKSEAPLRPMAKGRYVGRFAHETQIQFTVIDRRLARIALGQKLQHNAIAETRWQRNVCLQRNAFTRRSWKQIAKARHRRIATVRADQRSRSKSSALCCFDLPTSSIRDCGQCRYRCLFMNLRAEVTRSRHQQRV